MRSILIGLIRGYQMLLSPWVGRCCRFYPSCSQYWIDALRAHGAARGCWLGVLRLSKCHPFHPGGYDPVPRGIPRVGYRVSGVEG